MTDVVQPRSSENRPSSTPPISVGSRTMRPWASHAARPEPTAIATEKIVRKTVTTLFAAADVERHQRRQQRHHQRADEPEPARHQPAPPQPRFGADVFDQRARWKRKCCDLIDKVGAPSPVGGMNRLATQHATDDTIISQAKWIGSPPSLAGKSGDDGAERMARKVPPSTSALPAGNSERARWSGRMPYLIGPNSDAMVPYRNHGDEQQHDRMDGEAGDRKRGDGDLDKLQPPRHQRLVVTVGEFAAERRKGGRTERSAWRRRA